MNKQSFFLIGVALVLATLYIVYFTDLFKHENIQISNRISPASGSMVFYLNKPYPLTSIKVVGAEEAKTNKFPHALWHMVSDSAPTNISTFNYGAKVAGMKPEIATALPEPLEPNVDYSLMVEASGNLKGEKTFQFH